MTSQWTRTLVLLFALALSTSSWQQIEAQPLSIYPSSWWSPFSSTSDLSTASTPASSILESPLAEDPLPIKNKIVLHPPIRKSIEDLMRRNHSLGAPLHTPDFLKRRNDSPTVVILTMGTRGTLSSLFCFGNEKRARELNLFFLFV